MPEPDVTCPECAQPNPARAKFCLECGAAMVAAPARRGREERKVVSVLFADLVGFTAQAEQLDPEEVRAILAPYHTELRTQLERHGGTVEKFIGDAVMALFGAPVAHEDDPERAVRAGLAIREALKEDGRLHVRIGITTGEALVTLDARPESGEGMASGDVVNSAARLQTAAPVDGILVDDATHRATSRAIAFDDHPAVSVKGKSEPMSVHLAVAARARHGSDVRQSGHGSLIGRTGELEVLAGALERAKVDRQPQLVTVVGVPGIGKSRLVWELFQRVDSSTDLVTWRQGRCLPYAESISYWALGEIVKGQAGILETDPPDEAQEKVRRSVSDIVGNSPDADWTARHLGMLVGTESGSELRGDHRGEAFAAWRGYLEALADQGPTVLVFEDIHWADDGLLDFIDHLIDWATDVPLLVVAMSRPELLARRPGWGGGKTNATTISLPPLSESETRALVASLVEQAVIPVSVSDKVLERAQGNPLYAEEFARLVAERGHMDDLPESVQGIIAARLDGLAREEKELLQDAAVVGKVFWSGALLPAREETRTQVEQRLHALERKEFIRRDRRSSLADETEYSFRHILVRDVAYGQIPRAERAERHARVAAWLEQLGRPVEHAELLAGHYVAALELARAAGRSFEGHASRAREALLQAGGRALGLNAFASAARHFRAAIDLMSADDPARPAALFGYGKSLRISQESGSQELALAEDGLRASGNFELAAEAAVLQAELAWFAGDGERSAEHLGRAAEMATGLPPSFSKAYVLSDVSRYRMISGESESAIEVGEQALAIAEHLGLDEIRAHALNNIGSARSDMGDPAGVRQLQQALEIATAIRSREMARVLINLAAAYSEQGDPKRTNESILQAIVAARELGDASPERFARAMLPEVHYGRGDWDEALELLNELLADAETAGGHVLESICLIIRSRIRFARGDAPGATDDGMLALDAGRRVGDPQSLVPALANMILLQAEVGPESDLAEMTGELLELAKGDRFVPVDAIAVMLEGGRRAGVLALIQRLPNGRHRNACELVSDGRHAEAAALMSELEDEPTAAFLHLMAARRLLAEQRPTEAAVELAAATSFWQKVGGTHFLAKAQELIANRHAEPAEA